MKINFVQSYTLPSDWRGLKIEDDPTAPANGFKFVNKASQAAAVLNIEINGRQSPIYMNAGGLMSEGEEVLIPTQKVAVWFQRHGYRCLMSSVPTHEKLIIDMTGRTQALVEYGKGMEWALLDA